MQQFRFTPNVSFTPFPSSFENFVFVDPHSGPIIDAEIGDSRSLTASGYTTTEKEPQLVPPLPGKVSPEQLAAWSLSWLKQIFPLDSEEMQRYMSIMNTVVSGTTASVMPPSEVEAEKPKLRTLRRKPTEEQKDQE